MIDETVSPNQTPLPGSADLAATEEDEPQPSIIRTRIVPAIAGLLMLTIVGLILWSMFAPESARKQSARSVGGAIVLNNPKPVDDFVLTPLDGGEPVSLSDYRGKTVVINFWATWCQPCIREIPILMQANRQLGDDVVLIGLNTLDDKDAAVAMMAEFGMNYPNLNDNDRTDGSVAVEFGVVGVPETYIINAEGELVAFRRGDFGSASDVLAMVALAQ
jgi:cytochrome c biogenesis protein CcmG, thiol:disulfide interchange protein DsbE